MSKFVRIRGESPQETIRFSRACDAVGGQIGHIRPDGETAATYVVELLDRGATPLFAHLLASHCRFSRHFIHINES